MSRKPTVPVIPAKPIGRTKPKQAQADPKQPRPVEQFDLWDVFAGSQEPDDVPEALRRVVLPSLRASDCGAAGDGPTVRAGSTNQAPGAGFACPIGAVRACR
jgi:hypothetical protein